MAMRVLLAALLAVPAFAQLQVVVLEGTTERPVTTQWSFGQVAAGEALENRFLVKNLSSSAVTVTRLVVEGAGFTLFNEPSLPRIIAPASSAPFSIRFIPPAAAAYAGRLRINEFNVELAGTGTVSLGLEYLSGGSASPVTNGQTLDLGVTPRRTALSSQFRIVNRTNAAATADPPSVSGDSYRVEGWTGARNLAANESASFTVVFQSETAGVKEALLRAAGRDVRLRVTAQELPVPQPSLAFTAQTLENARQERLSIALESPAPDDASGTVTLQFTPAAGLVDDPAIAFLPAGTRSRSFRVRAGSTKADFEGAESLAFQTGSTAGTFVFTVQLGTHQSQQSFTIAPGRLSIESAEGLLSDQSVEFRVRGFDNSRSASRLRFVFYLKNGQPLGQGPIDMDAGGAFANYFATNPGGVFFLRVHFPVSGTASELGSADVEFTNANGLTKADRLKW
jgi:hypothetical protein